MDVHLKILFARFQEQFGSGPGLGPGLGTCLLKVDGVDPPFVRSLYKAAAALYRTDPWKRLHPGHLFGVKLGKDSDWSCRKQPFPCVQFIGGDGGDIGFHMFRSEDDARKMTGPRETIRVPQVEVFRVTYRLESLMYPSTSKMNKSLSLEVSGSDRFPVFDVTRCTLSGDLQFRNPTFEELKFAYGFMRGIALLHPLLQQDYDVEPNWSKWLHFEPFIETVSVQWPSEIVNGNDLVAVTVSHPPSRKFSEKNDSSAHSTPTKSLESYKEKTIDAYLPSHSPSQKYMEKSSSSASSTPTRYLELFKEENFVDGNMDFVGSLRQCSMCEKEFSREQSVFCVHCAAVVYCSSLCQQQHWKMSHVEICSLYKAMMEREEELAIRIFKFNCSAEEPCKWLESLGLHQKGMWRRKCDCYSRWFCGMLPVNEKLLDSWGGLSEDAFPSDSPLVHYSRDGMSTPIFISNWSEYYQLRSLPLTSPVADILSHPLTIYYILTALEVGSKSLLMKGQDVVLHYLGPEGELDWLPAFSEISHLLHNFGNVLIIMVGPEIPSSLSGSTFEVGGRVKVNLIKGTYEDEFANMPKPQVVMALNCGLELYSSWNEALELIKSIAVPAFFSCQSEISCSNAKLSLRNGGLQISYPVTPNPFRSPVRQYGPSSNLPSYSNCFLLGVNT